MAKNTPKNVMTKYQYFVTYEIPEADINSWQIISTERPLKSTADVSAILSQILIMAEADPPIRPINISYLSEYNIELPDTVILYQMGRVGSVSLRSALESLEIPTRHVHYLADYGEYESKHDPAFLNRIKIEERVWTVVSVVRNPIARNLSAFFWNINKYYSDIDNNPDYCDALLEAFLEKYPHNITSDWFDNELNKVFDFDVYSKPFDHANGYTMYERLIEKPKFIMSIIRTEDITRSANHMFNSLLGVKPKDPLGTVNVTQKRMAVSKAFLDFHGKAVLPQAYLNDVLNTKYCAHFYTKEERMELFNYWQSDPASRKGYSSNG